MAQAAAAVICRELDKPVVVEQITVDSPKRGEVLIKLAACGVCHSDLSATNGTIPLKLPLILGHEAAGEVVEVGEGVDSLAPGDHVVSSFIYMCGHCRFCAMGRPVLCLNQGKALTTLPDGTLRTRDARGEALNVFSGCGVMAEYATLSVENIVKIDRLHSARLRGIGGLRRNHRRGRGFQHRAGRAGFDSGRARLRRHWTQRHPRGAHRGRPTHRRHRYP